MKPLAKITLISLLLAPLIPPKVRAADAPEATTSSTKGFALDGSFLVVTGEPGPFSSMTVALSVRPEPVANDFASLLSTRGWNQGGLHLLLLKTGISASPSMTGQRWQRTHRRPFRLVNGHI